MCGRFALYSNSETIENHFRIKLASGFFPHYNIAPSQQILTITTKEDRRQPVYMRWGLIPGWAKDMKIGYKMINARAESVAEKPAFRAAFKRRRCLIPASGFYEWETRGTGKKPYFIKLKGSDILTFAGLWESLTDEDDGKTIDSCTIITTEANRVIGKIHNRMPAIIEQDKYAQWLSPVADRDQLLSLLKPFFDNKMVVYPVGPEVNNPRNDTPQCIEKLSG
jgi:putative SOS response-associated peptidase YedK